MLQEACHSGLEESRERRLESERRHWFSTQPVEDLFLGLASGSGLSALARTSFVSSYWQQGLSFLVA